MTQSEVVVIRGISLEDVERVDSQRKNSRMNFRIFLYHPKKKLITIPSIAHEVLRVFLGTRIFSKASKMRLENELLGAGAAKLRRNGTRAAGEGDSSYKNGNVW